MMLFEHVPSFLKNFCTSVGLILFYIETRILVEVKNSYSWYEPEMKKVKINITDENI